MPRQYGPDITGEENIVERRGHRDYIEVNGRRYVVRKWDHHSGRWKLNTLGLRWAARKQAEYVVSIPCIFKIRRKNGEEAQFLGYLPATNTLQGDKLEDALKMGIGLQRDQAIARIKEAFIQILTKYREDDGAIILFYESDAVAVFDENREWQFSELSMVKGPDNTTVQNALLDQPMRVPHYSQIIHSECFIPEAFHEIDRDTNCACY